ncbi:nuclear transport factor 2 family protein [Henriciella sp. AS95]|uniref:nuclear transport factor 2 family protein n=1 Tax=Henriciella sp. AS95 TaxID=3135782 RepID=UPI00317E6F1B
MKNIIAFTTLGLVAATAGLSATAQTPPVDPEMEVVEAAEDAASATNLVKGVYAGFESGDIAAATSGFAEEITWNEAENSPYADKNPYVGAEAIVTGVFARLGGEWDYFNAVPSEYIAQGDRVAVIGRYQAKHATTGKEMDIPFVHVWTVEDGAITGFQQYTDTLTHTEVMSD